MSTKNGNSNLELPFLSLLVHCRFESVADLDTERDVFIAVHEFGKGRCSLFCLFEDPFLAEVLLGEIEKLNVVTAVADVFSTNRRNSSAVSDVIAGIEKESAAVDRALI